MLEQQNTSGLDPVGEVITEDAARRKVPTMAGRLIDQRKQDQAEAAELQSWLVGNARTVRPVDGSGLFAWALAALKAQSDKSRAEP